MSIKVRFVSADGDEVQEVAAKAGDRLLDVAQAAGQPLEGTCEGQMACSTCHVIVAAEDFARLPRASVEEDDLLDLAARVTRTSRLACQIWLEEGLDGLTVRIPPEARNMQGR
jgi:ferredoxin